MTSWTRLGWNCCGKTWSRSYVRCPECGTRKKDAKRKAKVKAEPTTNREREFVTRWQQLAPHLPKPVCQYAIPEQPSKPFDLAWVDAKILVEVDGGTGTNGAHNRPVGMHRDNVKRNSARAYGWRVFEVDTLSFADPHEMIEPIKRALENVHAQIN